jgi:hypothetical protein
MFKRRSKRDFGPIQIADGAPRALAQGAEETAHRLAEAVESTGARVAKGAGSAGERASELGGQLGGRASDLGGQLGGRASELGGQLGGRASELGGHLSDRATELGGHLGDRASELGGHLGDRATELGGQLGDRIGNAQIGHPRRRRPRLGHAGRSGAKPKLKRLLSGVQIPTPAALHVDSDARLKSQLVKTSRELAHESSDLSRAVDSLNAVIKANRKAAAKGRTRLIGGLAIGAVLMYHFDAEHGHERRAATARRLRSAARGR